MKKWNVSTLDTMAVITLDEDGLYLESLCLNGEERVIKTQIVFPKYYRAIAKDYRDTRGKKEFCWEYYSDILNFLCFLTLKAIYAVTRPHPDHHNTRALCEHSPSYIPDCLIRHSPEDRQ